MTNFLRAVVDTNVFVSASLSKNANSPTREPRERWKRNEVTLLICDQIAKELIEKLKERGIPPEEIIEQASALAASAEWVVVPEEKIEALLSDPDDNVVVACAVEGKANYLVTYDPHFDSLQGESGSKSSKPFHSWKCCGVRMRPDRFPQMPDYQSSSSTHRSLSAAAQIKPVRSVAAKQHILMG